MLYIKALHIIFIVTWFAGLFYITRLFIYNTENHFDSTRSDEVKSAFFNQYNLMCKRLWLGITWPSAIITFIMGPLLMYKLNYHSYIFEAPFRWLLVKLIFVIGLYIYHFTLHVIYKQQQQGIFKYSSQKLRIWNEVATLFLFSIVMLVVVKQSMSFVYGIAGLILLIVILMSAIKLYKLLRKN
jgi:putative membrane protein